jgi:hypothetical protein
VLIWKVIRAAPRGRRLAAPGYSGRPFGSHDWTLCVSVPCHIVVIGSELKHDDSCNCQVWMLADKVLDAVRLNMKYKVGSVLN